ncbi:lysophospholipid acyltransferase family protein [Prosthecomicrobium hirschii]|uniref:lysophospholipid acyltransferase family protein n=1 Tax=Prosthecodimorpha hirschii TaxID=665126 RepID=UPI00221EF7DC|nr:lysophospholipid acyltransferase family protein [Prosthecomicrobium hirschii]MCW1840959.1 lysophospholipid acyltransferase family protein [Prosthecomicrobium hirschii]
MIKALARSPAGQRTIGRLVAGWLRLLRSTQTAVIDPPDAIAEADRLGPFILAMWHGEHFMLPVARPDHWQVKAIISRSGDGEIIATVCERFGIGAIRASAGVTPEQIHRRGGVMGLIAALRELEQGAIVALTADVPKGPRRRAGEGIVAMARHSGRPVVPFAVATTHRFHLDNWDRAAINLPFGRFAFVIGEPIVIDRDEAVAAAQRRIEEGLDRVHARADLLVKGLAAPAPRAEWGPLPRPDWGMPASETSGEAGRG